MKQGECEDDSGREKSLLTEEYLSQGKNGSAVRFIVRGKFSVLERRICEGVWRQ